MNIEVVLALQARQYRISLPMPKGATIRQAVLYAFEKKLFPDDASEINPETAPLGIYGELEDDSYLLAEGDRVEIYRPLEQDPKEWRRQRANNKSAK